jgi:glucose/arabinose dehydrogenase
MRSDDLYVFLSVYVLAAAAALLFDCLVRRRWNGLALLALLGAFGVMVGLGIYVKPGVPPSELLAKLAAAHRGRHVVAAGLGAAAALPLLRATLPRASGAWKWLDQLLAAGSVAGVAGAAGVLLWNAVFDIKSPPPMRVFDRGFEIEMIGETLHPPVRLAVDDRGGVFVSYFWASSDALHGGGILRFEPDPEGDGYRERLVAESDLLHRATGLAWRDGALYVSRSGLHGEALDGRIHYVETGAVTRIEDRDGDGFFEYYHDVVRGLPGARGPDVQHQNNGIAFAPDGSLYVTNGIAASLRTPDEHPWGGAILKVSPDFSRVEVFAEGFRNPFGIAVTPAGDVFVTDNDAEENPGDEIDHVIAGEHYGHPFVVPRDTGVDPRGFREPVFLGSPGQNLEGLAWADSPALPEGFRSRLYVTDLVGHRVLRVEIEAAGESYATRSVEPFATVPTPVDVAAAPDGSLFVVSRYDRKLFRIRPRQAAAPAEVAP